MAYDLEPLMEGLMVYVLGPDLAKCFEVLSEILLVPRMVPCLEQSLDFLMVQPFHKFHNTFSTQTHSCIFPLPLKVYSRPIHKFAVFLVLECQKTLYRLHLLYKNYSSSRSNSLLPQVTYTFALLYSALLWPRYKLVFQHLLYRIFSS